MPSGRMQETGNCYFLHFIYIGGRSIHRIPTISRQKKRAMVRTVDLLVCDDDVVHAELECSSANGCWSKASTF
jgi:hypothetical protein